MATRDSSRNRYEVFGEFTVPTRASKAGGQTLDFSRLALTSFWEMVEAGRDGLRAGVGCYLFAVRAGLGIRPWYVGQAKKGFVNECFGQRNQGVYREIMGDIARGTPVLFLIARLTPTGRLAKRLEEKEADFVERKLIHDATIVNPELKNSHHTRFVKTLSIPGLLNNPQGKPSDAVNRLRLALGTQADRSD